MDIVKANGLHHHYKVVEPATPDAAGGAAAPAVVFANSLGTDFRIWDDLRALLPAAWRVVVYDMRGHGLSEAVPGDYSITDLADDLTGLLSALGIGDYVLVGLSVGGMVGQEMAARQAEGRAPGLQGVVLMDTGPKIGEAAMWQQRIDTVRGQGLDTIVDAVMGRWFTDSYQAAEPARMQGWRAMLARGTATGYAGVCAAIRDADLRPRLSGITLPAICVCGSGDVATPPDLVRAMAEAIPGAGYRDVAGAGHLPCIENPGDCAAIIQSFVEEITGER